MEKNSYWLTLFSEWFIFSLFFSDHVPMPLDDINWSMRVARMVHGPLFLFLPITMYLWVSRACVYASERTRSFTVCIILVYAKGLHLRSVPLCHDALHSIFHIKIKLHLTYSALYKSKSLLTILPIPHLISFIFCIFLIPRLGLVLCYIKNIIILHSCICWKSKMIQNNKSLCQTWPLFHLHISLAFIPYHHTFH